METKRCPRCGETKPLNAFYRQSSGAPMTPCIVCKRETNREYFARPGIARKHARLERERFWPRYKARRILERAIRAGRLVRPAHCTICFTPCKPQAHHENHDRPLEVIFCCIRCHRDLDAAKRFREFGISTAPDQRAVAKTK